MIPLLRRFWLVAFALGTLGFVAIWLERELDGLDPSFTFAATPLALAAAAQLAFWLLSSALWRGLVARTASHRMGLLDSFIQQCLVNLGKFVPGKIWGAVARGAHIREQHGVSTAAIVYATVLELTFQLATAVVVVAVLTAILWPTPVVTLLAALASLGALLATLLSPHLLEWSASRYARWAGVRWRAETAVSLPRAASLRFLAGYVGIWTLLGLCYFGVYLSVSATSGSLAELAVTIQATTAGYALGFVALFAPAGIGVREGTLAALLAPIAPLGDALMLALLFRLWTVVLEAGCGVLVLAVGGLGALRGPRLD